MIFRNTEALATTSLRRAALTILEAGLSAVDTANAIRRAVTLQQNTITIGELRFPASQFDRILVIGFGKASATAAAALEETLGNLIIAGAVIDTHAAPLRRIKSLVGTHPLPSVQNAAATRELTQLLRTAGRRDLVLVIVSGGGSALLCDPFEATAEELASTTKELMDRGAPIADMNTVRKHLSRVHGGQLPALAPQATILGLIFSDIPSDHLPAVASGPTILDLTTSKDAEDIFKKYRVRPRPLIETPKDPSLFSRTYNLLITGSAPAAQAMAQTAKQLGFNPRILSLTLAGEARNIGRRLADEPEPGEAIIAAGETTVTLRGRGKGGRNQEVALSALSHLPPRTLVTSCASDGVDNATPVAGALADAEALAQARALNLDPEAFLSDNNSFPFWQKVGTALHTGPTGINIADLFLALREK